MSFLYSVFDKSDFLKNHEHWILAGPLLVETLNGRFAMILEPV